MYSQIEITLQGVQQALQSSRAISTTPLPEGIEEEGDESVEDRAKVQKEKEQLIAKQIRIEEAVNKAFFSLTGLEQKAEQPIERQMMKLTEFIHQLQQRVVELELQTIP
jgi:hypothetical protein